jgi:hypothetical protein
MKTEEDEAFDDLAKRQGSWGGGFPAKRAMAAAKLFEDQINYGTSWSKDGERIDPRSVYLDEPAQEQWKCIGPPCKCNASNAKLCVYAVFTTPPLLAQEPYDQTALELCNVCGWKTLIPDDGCLNCEREHPAQDPWNEDEWRRNNWRCGHGWLRGEQCEICNAPQREWVGLTENTVLNMMPNTIPSKYDGQLMEFAKALEQTLKEKNNG